MRKHKIKSTIIYHVFCIALSFVMVYPLLWLLSSSFKDSADVFSNSYSLIPEKWNFSNYAIGWEGFGGIGFGTFFKNSFVLTLIQTLGAVISSVMVGYGFARIKFKGSNMLFGIMLMTMMIPYQIIMIPQFVMFHNFGWVNTYLPLILPACAGRAFDIFLIVQFVKGIPYEMDEAAMIDGCNEFTKFTKVILPLIKPVVATVFIFNFYQRWDDFMGPLLYLNSPEKYTISLALRSFADSMSAVNWGAMFAMSVLSLIPVILIYLFAQNQITEGISTTGLKG